MQILLAYRLQILSLLLSFYSTLCLVVVTVGVERSQEGDASDENDEAEFFDAMEDSPAFITVTTSGEIPRK